MRLRRICWWFIWNSDDPYRHLYPTQLQRRCYQNALAERVNGIVKQDFLLTRCNDINEIEKIVDESLVIYNNISLHLSLSMKTPSVVHEKSQRFELLAS